MKRSLLIGCWATSMLFMGFSYADLTLQSHNENSCADVSGQWTGSGKAYNWFIGECKYHGSGTVSEVEKSGRFTVEVIADKDSGNILCPAHSVEKLIGTCINNTAIITTKYGTLTGLFSQNEGTANGTLTVSPGVDAKVSIKFQR